MLNLKGNSGTRARKMTLPIDSFKGGVNRLLNEARLAPNEAKTALNLMQVEDGLWQPRWGTANYGADYGAIPDGAAEFLKTDGTTELICIAGGTAYKSTNGGAKTAISGATFTSGTQCYFLQIGGFLYIANGTDSLTRYDGTVLTTYASLAAPANLTATRVASGLASGTFTYFAEVTALNTIGETVGSTEASITVNKQRDTWVAATDKGITWSWNTVSGATRYQLYISEETGFEQFLVSTTDLNYTDDGSVQINPYVIPPLENTTTAPKFKSMALSGNRMWGTNDPNAKYKVSFSGTAAYMAIFSDFYGGGWINLENGGREQPTAVLHYQSAAGVGTATVLCRTPEGKGAVWQISITSATVGTTVFAIPSAIKVVGSFGTDAILGVVATSNDILFPNKRGIFSLGPEKNYYNVLRTNELSVRIRPYIQSLTGSLTSGVCGYFYDAKVFFSVPTTSSGNSRIIVYDTERLNWNVDWSVGVKQFFEYTDTSRVNHFMFVPVTGTQLVEMSSSIAGDLGVAFNTDYTSGRIPLAKLWKDFTQVSKVYVKLGSQRGTASFEVSGTEKSKPFTALNTASITSLASYTGMGFDLMGNVAMGGTNGTPSTYSDTSAPHYVKIRKRLRDIQFRLTTSNFNDFYTLQGLIVEGMTTETQAPSGWKVN